MKKLYTKEDIGCWIDGAFGLDHAASVLAGMLPYTILTNEGKKCVNRLRASRISDDHWEFDYATELLYDYTAKDLLWVWEAGDLILVTEDDYQNWM